MLSPRLLGTHNLVEGTGDSDCQELGTEMLTEAACVLTCVYLVRKILREIELDISRTGKCLLLQWF